MSMVVAFCIRLVSIFSKEDAVEISIWDTGIGIPENMKDVIFERFRQVDQSLTRNHEASGIGLSLVKSLVVMHYGTITLKSEYGAESNFIIRLSVKMLDVDSRDMANKSFEMEQSRIERIKVEFYDIYQAV